MIDPYEDQPIEDEDINFLQREGTKEYLQDTMKDGNFKQFRKYINKHGKYKWSNSELEEFCQYAWEYQSVKYLIDIFKLNKLIPKFF